LYAMTWITNIANVIGNRRIWQAYSWAASLLLSWLAWYQLQPIDVSLAWGVFGLLLFELGYNTSSAFLRAQGYVALTCSFAHLFYSNFNTPLRTGSFDPHILLVVLLLPVYFWVYWRLHEKPAAIGRVEIKLRVEYLLACIGTATVAALARFEMPLEMVVAGYAGIVLALLVAAWLTGLEVFLYQAVIMLGITAFRFSMHNLRNLDGSLVSSLPNSIWALGLLAASIPVAFKLRSKDATYGGAQKWIGYLVRRPEQALFFPCVVLTGALLAIKLPQAITLAWAIEGIVVFILALLAKERSFRLTGLALVLLCVAKIACWDAWKMNDLLLGILTFIGLGIVMLLVHYLYTKNRERLREYL
jgi:hypothetical protein